MTSRQKIDEDAGRQTRGRKCQVQVTTRSSSVRNFFTMRRVRRVYEEEANGSATTTDAAGNSGRTESATGDRSLRSAATGNSAAATIGTRHSAGPDRAGNRAGTLAAGSATAARAPVKEGRQRSARG